MADLIRIADLARLINTEESNRLYSITYRLAHSHPRGNKAISNIFRRLRKMAIEIGVWDQHKNEYSQ